LHAPRLETTRQAPKFYWELKDREKNYGKVVWYSFAGSMALMIATVTGGFLTFGGNSNSLILNNYSKKDALMSLSQLAVTVSLTFSYPLAFVGVRDNVLNLAKVPVEKRTARLNDILTLTLLAAITGLALVVKDIGLILSLGGATWGTLLIYVMPALMVIKAAALHPELKSLVPLSYVTGTLGLGLGVVGTIQAIKSI
jgi:amino acid permease